MTEGASSPLSHTQLLLLPRDKGEPCRTTSSQPQCQDKTYLTNSLGSLEEKALLSVSLVLKARMVF